MKNARKYGYSEFPRAVVIPGGACERLRVSVRTYGLYLQLNYIMSITCCQHPNEKKFRIFYFAIEYLNNNIINRRGQLHI